MLLVQAWDDALRQPGSSTQLYLPFQLLGECYKTSCVNTVSSIKEEKKKEIIQLSSFNFSVVSEIVSIPHRLFSSLHLLFSYFPRLRGKSAPSWNTESNCPNSPSCSEMMPRKNCSYLYFKHSCPTEVI